MVSKLSPDAVHVVAILEAKPGRVDELRRKLEAAVALVRKEEGCIAYNLHVDRNDERRFVMIETWANQHALDAHAEGTAFKALAANFDDLLDGPLGLTLTEQLA